MSNPLETLSQATKMEGELKSMYKLMETLEAEDGGPHPDCPTNIVPFGNPQSPVRRIMTQLDSPTLLHFPTEVCAHNACASS